MAGGFSSLSGSATAGIDNYAAEVVIGTVAGGTAAEIGGGKFANGAVTGAFTVMYNHLMHDAFLKLSIKNLEEYKQIENYGRMYNSKAEAVKKAVNITSMIKKETQIFSLIDSDGNKSYFLEAFINNGEDNATPTNLRCLKSEGYTLVEEDHYSIRDCSDCSSPSYYTVSKNDFIAAQDYQVSVTHHTIGLGSWTIVGPVFLTSFFFPENRADFCNPKYRTDYFNAKYGANKP
ncbi:MAG TPA: hypothetical protein PKH58_08085 [Paludibacteraceae bacterium]|nr:hypothetical protein [Paludibacteraceae bacterium]